MCAFPISPRRHPLTHTTLQAQHWRAEDKLYYCIITHPWPHQIVGYPIKPTTHTDIIVNPIRHPLQQHGNLTDYILHTDPRSQLRSQTHTRALHQHDTWSDRGGQPGQRPTTPRWNRSVHRRRKTSSTSNTDGQSPKNCAYPSSPR